MDNIFYSILIKCRWAFLPVECLLRNSWQIDLIILLIIVPSPCGDHVEDEWMDDGQSEGQ